MKVRAARVIEAGEEITIAYTGVIAQTKARQKALEPYEIVCTCPACSNPVQSDRRRTQILLSDVLALHQRRDPLQAALEKLNLLELEGLQSIDIYRTVLQVVADRYIDKGDKEKAMQYGRQLYEAQCALGQGKAYLKYRDLDKAKWDSKKVA